MNKDLSLAAMVLCLISLSYSQEGFNSHTHVSYQKGVEYYNARKLDSAYVYLCRELDENPTFARAYYFLGLVFHDVSMLDSAEVYYRKAIHFDPTYADPYSDLTVIKINQGRLDEASEFANKCIELDSTFVKAHINLASVYFRLGNKDAASAELLRAATLDPDQIHEIGTAMLVQHNDPLSAEYYYRIVLQAHKEHAHTLFSLGQTERILGKLDSAEAHLEHAFKISDMKEESFQVLYSSYFRLLFDLKKYDKLLSQCFLRVGESFPSAYFFRSLTYFNIGDHQKFVSEADRYFDLSGRERPQSLDSWAKEKIRPKR